MLGYEFSVVLSVMLLCIWLGLCCVLSSFFDHFIYFKFGEVIDFRLFRATVRRIVARRGGCHYIILPEVVWQSYRLRLFRVTCTLNWRI